jgi:hypothetical protein
MLMHAVVEELARLERRLGVLVRLDAEEPVGGADDDAVPRAALDPDGLASRADGDAVVAGGDGGVLEGDAGGCHPCWGCPRGP